MEATYPDSVCSYPWRINGAGLIVLARAKPHLASIKNELISWLTGLVLTPEGRISLGRARKREISAGIHHIQAERNVSPEHVATVRGWLAYANSVEPTFYNAMVRKYGDVVTSLMRAPLNDE
jgi:hypothetical protein